MPPQTQTPPLAVTPIPHEHDSVAITNIDIDCHETTVFTVERSTPVAPIPGENNPMNIPIHQSQQEEGEFDHSQYFEVRYNSQPFRILPGETKVWPRYIAEHYAKHLADHILQKMEDEEEKKAKKAGLLSWRKGLVQSSVERPKVLKKILEVRAWFLEGRQDDPNALQLPDDGTPAQDLGNVPNYAVGNLRPEPKSAEQILAESGEYTPPETISPGPTIEAPGVDARVANKVIVDSEPPEPATTQASVPPVDASGLPLGPDSLNSPTVAPDDAPAPQGERTKPELIREAVMLGIEVTGRENVDELKQKIAAF